MDILAYQFDPFVRPLIGIELGLGGIGNQYPRNAHDLSFRSD
jgi:hypothetical protein